MSSTRLPLMSHNSFYNMEKDCIKLFVLSQSEIYADGIVRLLMDNSKHNVTCLDIEDDCIRQFSLIRPDVLVLHQRVV